MLAVVATLAAAPASRRQDPKIAPFAPKDKPVLVIADQYKDLILACEPYVKKARDTYAAAKARYMAGLPPGQSFFVTARLVDDAGRMEQIFVAVDRIADESSRGASGRTCPWLLVSSSRIHSDCRKVT